MGNTYEGGKVCTDQYVCPSLLAEFDISVGDTKTGLSMVHELAESFYGGQIALQNKKSSPIAGSDGSTYNESHKRANEIAVGNRGPIYLKVDSPGINYSFFKAGDYLHRIGQDGKIDYFHLYIQIGWKRTTDKNGM